ncbi:MAG: multiphosphoryl transfer protein [Gaiellaceae bacterium]|nr:multiphosphoryl transfer protein [Gaiellaceae bacterium]
MSQHVFRGLAASSGIAVASVLVVRDVEIGSEGSGVTPDGPARAVKALGSVAADLARLALAARNGGRDEEAEILEANLLMAEDPSLLVEVEQTAATMPAAAAVTKVTERHAALLAELDNEYLAARAADIRHLGQRAARILTGGGAMPRPERPSIVVARDLGPADVAELELSEGLVVGIALAEGAATSHVAIMARALGLPMSVALGETLLTAHDAEEAVLDGDNGFLVLDPTTAVRAQAERAIQGLEEERRLLAATRGLPAVTTDGRELRLLCNAATVAEVDAGLEAGAEGVGLLRTELAFLEAPRWPSVADHRAALEWPLAQLDGRVATVRTLDFGADKTPPFLTGIEERGLRLALSHPSSFVAQLKAILQTGRDTSLRILLPLVESERQFRTARSLLVEALHEVDWQGPTPELGAMIETPEAAGQAGAIAGVADFLSIGTNDLVQYTLGLDRELPLATAQAAADPAVLALIVRIAEAAHSANLSVEVCGEAAGELPVTVLLVGAGIDELSVSPARVDAVRGLVRSISADDARAAVRSALTASSAVEALAIARELIDAGPSSGTARSDNGLSGVVA